MVKSIVCIATLSLFQINNNGYLTFDWPWYSYIPYQFPGYGGEDVIAPFWTDIDNRGNGVISYRQYTSGSVLTEATQDINQYFPDLSFSATCVFVATWDRVAYYPYSGTVRNPIWFCKSSCSPFIAYLRHQNECNPQSRVAILCIV